ncbi:4'-phosphopantetheinyl transferase family protein [Novosphingobium sp. KCTC 2891]|nr:4'-phosphopantetheinyl transferase superfamily protein [Novosphingobium sp. KCTC 2891]
MRKALPALPALSGLPRLGEGPIPAPGPCDVHVWRYDHTADIDDARLVALAAMLSPDEIARSTALRDARRRQFVVGRALCRHVLSRYAQVPPQDWRFALGDRGKPSIAAPALASPLWFSLSHADGVSVCAVTSAGPEIGIDIECVVAGRDALDVAVQFFPEAEAHALRELPPMQREERFVQLWALKESYVKARQISLADGLGGTTFDLARPDDIGVIFADALGEHAQQWRFSLFRLDEALIFALALRTDATAPLRLRSGTCPLS